jgi:precorrin-6B methylase 2
MNIESIAAGIGVLEHDERLWEDTNITVRKNAIEHIAFAEAFAVAHLDTELLRARLTALKKSLMAVDTQLFNRLRTEVQQGSYKPADLRTEFDAYTDYAPWKEPQPHIGPDGLDTLLDGIQVYHGQFGRRAQADPDMVHYEPTPARAILELIDKTGLRADQVVYDIGSGIGRVSILLNLLTGATSKGVEIDPVLAAYAQNSSNALKLNKVSFINADARTLDYADGDVFFMFTPFLGNILQTVLVQLKQRALTRPITLGTFGRCTRFAAKQDWLRHVSGEIENDFSLAIFQNR